MKTLSILLSMECAKFCGSCGNVPSWLCGYFVGPNYFLVGISWVQSIFSWVFRGSKMFPCRYFVSPKIFSWVFLVPEIFSRGFKIFPLGQFRDFQLLTAWEKVAQKYIWNCVFFSKSISAIYIQQFIFIFSNYLY